MTRARLNLLSARALTAFAWSLAAGLVFGDIESEEERRRREERERETAEHWRRWGGR